LDRNYKDQKRRNFEKITKQSEIIENKLQLRNIKTKIKRDSSLKKWDQHLIKKVGIVDLEAWEK